MSDLADLNWDDLRYFVLAARAGTLAGAARSAGVQHTTIGRRLTALERSLGAPLFMRGPDGLVLTPLGDQLMPLALEVERGVLAVRQLALARRTRVRLALPSGFIAVFAQELVRFGRQHPELTVETIAGSQLLDLKRGDADMALRIGPIHDDELVARRLGEVGLSLYASAAYVQSHPALEMADGLAGHQIIGYGSELSAVPAARWLDAHAAKASTVLSTNEISTMVAAALTGVGIAMLPCMLGDSEPRLLRLTPDVLARRELSLVYRREARLNDAVRVTAAFIVDVMRAHANLIGGER